MPDPKLMQIGFGDGRRAGNWLSTRPGHGGVVEGRVGDGGALHRRDHAVGIAGGVVGIGDIADIADIQRVAAAARIEQTSPSMVPLLLMMVPPVVPAEQVDGLGDVDDRGVGAGRLQGGDAPGWMPALLISLSAAGLIDDRGGALGEGRGRGRVDGVGRDACWSDVGGDACHAAARRSAAPWPDC